LKKPVSAFRAEKMWSPLPRIQRCVKTLRHSPCDYIPNAAVTLMTCGVSLLSSKNIGFCFYYIAVHGHSDTLPVVKATEAALGVSSHGV